VLITTMNDLPGHRIDEVFGEVFGLTEGKGANAIIAFRYDRSELGTSWTEVGAYGTACKVTKS
jgi:uncharacterized protein YbjQ (UPF0145 family)